MPFPGTSVSGASDNNRPKLPFLLEFHEYGDLLENMVRRENKKKTAECYPKIWAAHNFFFTICILSSFGFLPFLGAKPRTHHLWDAAIRWNTWSFPWSVRKLSPVSDHPIWAIHSKSLTSIKGMLGRIPLLFTNFRGDYSVCEVVFFCPDPIWPNDIFIVSIGSLISGGLRVNGLKKTE